MSIPKGAALGSTHDPKALVIGDASSLDHQASSLKTEAVTMDTVGGDLKAVKTPSWTGQASTAFWGNFSAEPAVWMNLSDLMTKAAGALTDQAEALRTAQGKAQHAIELWDQAEAATKKAVADHNASEAKRAASAPAGVTLPAAPFHDPGDALRAEAQTVLDEACTALDEAGTKATSKLCELGGISYHESSGEASGPGAETSSEGPEFTFGNDKNIYDRHAPWQKPGEDGDHDPKAELSLGSVSAEAYVAKLAGSVNGNYKGIEYGADGEVKFLDAEAGASAAITNEGIKGAAHASATLLTASGSAEASYGYLHAKAEGTAYAGAEASGEASIGKDGVHASGEVFAGAKATGSVGADVGGVGGKVTGEAWAGVGASADVDAGYDDGTIHIGLDVGAGLGVGGKLGGEVNIDVGEVVDTGKDVVDGLGDAADDVGDFLGI